ncbi:hypothetical protein ACIA2T_04540 [Amycolatopsis japonica]|uniref:hypothetical protein n=1 Tax=Amycolatopsis japonica TaxID=208439 RepID=UPI00379A10C1
MAGQQRRESQSQNARIVLFVAAFIVLAMAVVTNLFFREIGELAVSVTSLALGIIAVTIGLLIRPGRELLRDSKRAVSKAARHSQAPPAPETQQKAGL